MLSKKRKECLYLLNQELDKYQWAITGSMGLVLQGMPIEARDIDVITHSKKAVDYFNQKLKKFEVDEPRKKTIKKEQNGEKQIIGLYGARYSIEDTKVDIFSDFSCRVGDKWIYPLRIEINYVSLSGRRIPVISLKSELKSFRKTGRTSRAKMIEKYMKRG